MLIEALKTSIFNCFCKACMVSSIKDQAAFKDRKPTTRQQNIVFVATEVRAEQTKGGMAFDVILAPASVDNPPRAPSPPKRPLSVDDIENKLKAAEERRLSLEALKLNQLTEKWNRLEEVSQKKQEFNQLFAKASEEKLVQKMETIKENRENQIKALQERLKEHEKHVNEVRETLESKTKLVEEKIEKKLTIAQENRDAQFKAIQERLHEHENHVLHVRQERDNMLKASEERLVQKLKDAINNREAQQRALLERLKAHEKRVEMVRKSKLDNQENINLDVSSG